MKLHSWCVAVVLACASIPASSAHADAQSAVQDLAKARAAAASRSYAAADKRYQTGTGTLEVLIAWSVRWYEADVAAATKRADATTAIDNHLARLRQIASFVDKRIRAGASSTDETIDVQYYVAEALYWQAKLAAA